MSRRHSTTPVARPSVGRWLRMAEAAVEAAAFWGAVVSPLAYPLVLFASPGVAPPLLVGLLATNVACLLVGHGYATDASDATDGAVRPSPARGGDGCRN